MISSVYYIKRSMMVSRKSRIYYQELLKKPAFGANGFDLDELRKGMATRQQPANQDIRIVQAQIDGIPGEWVVAPGADPDIRLLYLHGGGFVSGSGAFYLTLAAHISVLAQCAVLLPDYRLAPEHRFPAGLEDCVGAYEWMKSSGPYGLAPAKVTFIAGDSAGGGLTLSTLLVLRDRQRPLPAAGIVLSPFADLTLKGESTRTEAEKDPIMSPLCLPTFVDFYLGGTDPTTPLASPIFGDYHSIPPLLIQVGEYEIIRDDSLRIAAKARSEATAVTLEVWPGMFHVFQSHEPLLPEGKEAIKHIARFMQSCLPH
jgi:monoterpene epsilon-lactone hydrolase